MPPIISWLQISNQEKIMRFLMTSYSLYIIDMKYYHQYLADEIIHISGPSGWPLLYSYLVKAERPPHPRAEGTRVGGINSWISVYFKNNNPQCHNPFTLPSPWPITCHMGNHIRTGTVIEYPCLKASGRGGGVLCRKKDREGSGSKIGDREKSKSGQFLKQTFLDESVHA